jgi:hypothetical protein
MRLTLRTLLAWRDHTLSPADRADMDAKVSASEAAHVLLARIDRVGADDTLPAPHGHAAADPNAVAEYLDNVLPTAALDGFERACLQSDDLLAEVAASHRLLAEVNLDPRVLPTLGRAEHARLLKAFRARAEAAAHVASAAADTAGAPGVPGTPDPAPDAVVVRSASTDPRPPRTLERSSRGAWLLAVSAMLLLGALTGVLAWSVGRGRPVATRDLAAVPGRPLAEGVAQPTIAPAGALDATPPRGAVAEGGGATPPADPLDTPRQPALAATAADPAAVATAGAQAREPAVPATPPAAMVADAGRHNAPPSPPSLPVPDEPLPAEPALPAPLAPPPAIAATVPAPAAAQPAAATVPFGDALAIAARPVAPPTAAVMPASPPREAPGEPAADAVAAPADAMAVIGDDPLLLSAVAAGDDGPQAWMVARAGDRPAMPTQLLAPASCRPTLEIDGVRVLLTPGTLATLRRDDAGQPWLAVDVGAVVLVGAPGPAALRLSVAGLDGFATTVPGAPIGFEVVRGPARGGDGLPAAPTVSGLVYATGAAVPWRQIEPPPAGADTIPAGATLLWTTPDAGEVRITRRERTPAWLAALEPGDAFERAARSALGAALLSGDPAEPALERLAGERRSERRIAAAATLSLIGRHEPLASLLVEATPRRMLRDEEWTRLVRTAVPRALTPGLPGAAAFTRALTAAAPAGTGSFVAQLAGGIDARALDRSGRARLVDALESPWLVVRRSAWHTLLEIDPPDAVDRLRYRPDRATELNADGVRWWRERIGAEPTGPGGG